MQKLFGWFFLFFLTSSVVRAQSFQFAGKDAIEVPETSLQKIRHYIEKHDGVPQLPIGHQYPYIPVFNVLNRKERQFRDGLYYFNWGAHDSGRLFIQRKGTITFLANNSVTNILADYTSYLKQYPLPETTQINYLSAISAFMKFRYEDQNMLIKSGALLELKKIKVDAFCYALIVLISDFTCCKRRCLACKNDGQRGFLPSSNVRLSNVTSSAILFIYASFT